MESDRNGTEFEEASSFESILERLGEKYESTSLSGIDDEVDRFLNRTLRSEKESKRIRTRSEPRKKRDHLEIESQKAEVWGIDYTSQGWDPGAEMPYLSRISGIEQLKDEELFDLCGQIEAGVLAEEKLRILLDGSPTEERESKLAWELHQVAVIGNKAFQRLVEANLKLVAHVARKYQGLGLELMDLIQWGNIGLIRASQKFDREKGYKFSTYAFNWIEQSLRRGIAENSRLIRVPDHAFWKVQSILASVNKDDSYISKGRLLREAETKFREVFSTSSKEIFHTAIPIQSLDAPARYWGEELLPEADWDYLVDDFESLPERNFDVLLLALNVGWVLDYIPEQLGGVLRMRFGMFGDPKTLEEIGEVFGLTRERIRQLQKKAFEIIARDYEYLEGFDS